MNIRLARKIKNQLQKEFIRRSLNRFFYNKGYDNFNQALYPAVTIDLPRKVKELFNRVEIIPFVIETDHTTGVVKLGWNLFVLGKSRLYLGSTSHTNMSDLRMATMGQVRRDLPTEMVTTPQQVIDFILKILSSSRSGFVELPANFQLPPTALADPLSSVGAFSPRARHSNNGQFYSR